MDDIQVRRALKRSQRRPANQVSQGLSWCLTFEHEISLLLPLSKIQRNLIITNMKLQKDPKTV
jgi:hypothetical protein